MLKERIEMKKIALLIVTLMALFTLAACGEDDGYELVKGETPVTDRLELSESYENKNFIEDGIGEATLKKCNDGDTANFETGDEIITVRFLGIDTPESGHVIEPWGIPAGEYACDIMQNADTIVLESDPDSERKGTYGRYLAYVWADGRLLNLEMVEQGFAPAKGVVGFKYGDAFSKAMSNAQELELRIHGEDDPDFYYGEAIDVTIEDLVNNPEDYYLKRVNVEGIVSSKLGAHPFIQSLDGEHGIFFNLGHDTSNALDIGFKVIIEDAQFAYDTKDFEGLHLTNFDSKNLENPEDHDQDDFTVHSIPFSDLTLSETGLLNEYSDLTITNIDELNQLFTVKNSNGETLPVHQHENQAQNILDFSTLSVGDTINLKATLSEHNGELTFFLSHKEDVEITGNSPVISSYYIPEDNPFMYAGPRLDEHYFDMPLYSEDGPGVRGGGGAFNASLEFCTDGDTAIFDYPSSIDSRIESSANSTRFLNVDTPETFDGGEEEWGKTASLYTCDVLTNAYSIVLQTDPGDYLTGNYGRLLAWVWVKMDATSEYELLNYSIVRHGLGEVKYEYGAGETDVTLYDGLTYNEWMHEGEDRAFEGHRGMHGDLQAYYWNYETNAPHFDRWNE